VSPCPRLVVALALAASLGGAGARAYEFYFTKGGDALRWKRDETVVRTSTVAAEELSHADIDAAVDEAIATWTATGCVPTVARGGTTDATEGSQPASVRGPPDNIVVFLQTAEHWTARRHGRLEIAVTLISNNPATGEIVDADIEVNDAGFDFSVGALPGIGQVDFRSTLIHEMGHFFGLEHSDIRAATMHESYDAGDPTSKRSLHLDDIDGVCALYAIPFPPPPDDDCGAAGGGSSPAAIVIALAALVANAGRRRVVKPRAAG